jgi:DNA repair protein RadA
MAEGDQKKNMFIEDLSGVGPATAKKLQELGFNTIETLAMATEQELEPVGIGRNKVFEIIQEARSLISLPFIRTDELLKTQKNRLRLTIGSRTLNELLGGGLERGTITEFYGEYSSGKSQICHQLCINVQLPPERGGLNGGALYIDSEHTFRTERIIQMANNLKLDPEEVSKKIILAEAYTSDHQMFLLEKADKVIKDNRIRLIIVDSLTSHFRSEYLGKEMLIERQQKLNKHLHKLIRLGRAFDSVVVVTNQVMAKPDVFFGESVFPVGGHVLAHTIHTRVFLRKTGRGLLRTARLISSPYLPEGERTFKITENGIEDLQEKDQ